MLLQKLLNAYNIANPVKDSVMAVIPKKSG